MSARNRLLPHIRALLNFETPPSVVSWLEENIVMPVSMSPRQPGPFRVAARPQMAPILECFHPASGVRDITVSAGTQWAKTTIGCLGTCYLIKNAPGPMLIAGPSEDWTKEEIAKKRLRALIDENHTLRVEKPYNSDDFKLLHMSMIGMPIDLVGANSPTALAGSTRRYVIIEEASKIQHTEHEDAPEAHPIKNAMERTKDFAGLDLHYLSSTPNSPAHIFWQRYLAGSQTTFALRCPHCQAWFPLEWIYEGNRESIGGEFYAACPSDYVSVQWDKDARSATGTWDEEKVRATARFVCPSNGCLIDDEQKLGMIKDFEQSHANPLGGKDHRSFRIPSFYSPRVTFGDMALKFLDRGDLFTTGLQTFYNSWLALPWEETDVSVKMKDIEKCVEPAYTRGTIPFKPALLLLNADPGETLTHWEVVAVDSVGGLWVVDWGTVLSSRELISREFLKHRIYPISGTDEKMCPHLGYLDSGWQTEDQYDVCQASGGFLWPVKGSDAKHGSVSETRAASRPHLKLYAFSDRQAKNALYANRLNRQKDGGLHFPADADVDLKLGHANQKRDSDGEWARVAQDHFGDCSKYGVVGFWIARQAGLFI